MSNYLEHADDGRVLATMNACPIFPDAHYGGTVVEVDVWSETPGQLLYLDGEVIDLGPPPTPLHERDPDARAWRLPGGISELDLARDAAWAEIKRERDRREAGTFPYMGKQLQCDVVSVLRMTGAKEAALAAVSIGMTFSETWTCADNSLLLVDAEAVLGMLPALAVFSSSLHATARALRAQIYAEDATDATVSAVAWPIE